MTTLDSFALMDTTAETATRNSTTDYDARCSYYQDNLTFNNTQLLRVIVSWLFFVFSASGNTFVLLCLRAIPKKSHVHVIILHLTLADMAFTLTTIPIDATWNITMGWHGGLVLCKICQMLKQFGMYISSLMVVVIALDRVFSILSPMSPLQPQKRTIIMLVSAWIVSTVCAIPPAILYTIVELVYCEGDPPFPQCIDNHLSTGDGLKYYYIFTMLVSFVVPLILVPLSYSLVACEMTNMIKRQQVLMGHRAQSFADIQQARRKTLILTSLVTLTFVFFWGPYYAMALFDWFNHEHAKDVPHEVTMWLFVAMYVHPAIHPFIYGVFMRSVRLRFMRQVENFVTCITCSKKKWEYSGAKEGNEKSVGPLSWRRKWSAEN